MANSLLDFVMSLVRDPDAAARYAADPMQAIADANLTGVTSADVSNLIPVVSESLSMGAAMAGADAALDGNVWASGAATAAFDAFGDAVPADALDDAQSLVIDQPLDQTVDSGLDPVADHAADYGIDDPSSQLDATVIDDVPGAGPDSGLDDLTAWQQPAADGQEPDADAGFDIFS
ncbi:MAG: Rv0340 family IniB-related protein [Mycobacterium sp.]